MSSERIGERQQNLPITTGEVPQWPVATRANDTAVSRAKKTSFPRKETLIKVAAIAAIILLVGGGIAACVISAGAALPLIATGFVWKPIGSFLASFASLWLPGSLALVIANKSGMVPDEQLNQAADNLANMKIIRI